MQQHCNQTRDEELDGEEGAIRTASAHKHYISHTTYCFVGEKFACVVFFIQLSKQTLTLLGHVLNECQDSCLVLIIVSFDLH